MAFITMILGESGTGKSASLRNFNPDELGVINVNGKPLPFRARKFEVRNTDSYPAIRQYLKTTDKKSIVIDDAQYLMANEFMRRAREKGYDRFTEIGQNFWNLIRFCADELPDDMIVNFLQHVETGMDGKTTKAKTIGKMLDEKITLEGMFTVVLRTLVNDDGYWFSTQNNGADTVKSPVGMFEDVLIPNDLKLVDTAIREYYELESETSEPNEQIYSVDGQMDINAPNEGIVDDETPLKGLTKYGEIRAVMDNMGISDEEMRSIVADKDIYPFDTPISKYDPDFINYLIDNIKKIYSAIVAKRDPLG